MKVFVKFVGPVADTSDMDTEVVGIFWSRADGEGMPLKLGDGGDLDEAPVTWTVVELGGLLDLQTGYFRGQGDALINDSLSMTKEVRNNSVKLLSEKNDCKEDQPLPEAWGVNDQKTPVKPIVEVGEVEDLEVSTSADKTHGAYDHDSEDDDEGHTSGVGKSSYKSKHTGPGSEHPLSIAPSEFFYKLYWCLFCN